MLALDTWIEKRLSCDIDRSEYLDEQEKIRMPAAYAFGAIIVCMAIAAIIKKPSSVYKKNIGNMSVVGPRPALWNQDWLIACRDEYGANDIKPGLTGWAQIHGRDELEIPAKAKRDGEYKAHLCFMMDVKCFLGSLGAFGGDKSVVEGGTGKKKYTRPARPNDGKTILIEDEYQMKR